MRNDFSEHRPRRNIPLDRTPVIQMLSSFLKKETVSFHMPGHTGGKSFSRWLHRHALSIDATELDITDDANHPARGMKEASVLAAAAFGAHTTYLVTTGSTTSVYAAVLAVTCPGDKLILFRNVHRSFLNACVMFDLDPVFTTEATLAATLDAHPDAVAVVVTRPDYYGRCVDIRELSERVHASGRILIVDEAHGTHFAFCPSLLPLPAVSNGGDLVIHSAHKTAPSLTQGSFLHLSEEGVRLRGIQPRMVQEALSMITTSSPSFLIAATLDFARAFLQESGDAASRKLFALLTYFYSLLDPDWMPCFRPEGGAGGVTYDPFRLVITLRGMPFTAKELAEELSGRGIYIELHDFLRLVLICKFENSKADFKRLAKRLNRFFRAAKTHWENAATPEREAHSLLCRTLEEWDLQIQQKMAAFPARSCSPHCGMTSMHRSLPVPLAHACGKTVFSAIIPYPPGIPWVWPGEILSGDTAFLLNKMLEEGFSIYGIEMLPDEESGVILPHIRCLIDDSCRK